MNRTIEEHFYDSMPADIAAMAIRNTDENLLHMSICQTPAAALQKAFAWAGSDQGYAFWSSVFDTVSESRDFRDLKVSVYDLAMVGLKKLHAELLKDRKRLDWLETQEVVVSTALDGLDLFGFNPAFNDTPPNIRDLIDVQMEAEK